MNEPGDLPEATPGWDQHPEGATIEPVEAEDIPAWDWKIRLANTVGSLPLVWAGLLWGLSPTTGWIPWLPMILCFSVVGPFLILMMVTAWVPSRFARAFLGVCYLLFLIPLVRGQFSSGTTGGLYETCLQMTLPLVLLGLAGLAAGAGFLYHARRIPMPRGIELMLGYPFSRKRLRRRLEALEEDAGKHGIA